MSRLKVRSGIRSRRSAYTWIELVVVVVVLAVVLGLGTAGVADRQRAVGADVLHESPQADRLGHPQLRYRRTAVFPPGTVCSTGPVPPQNQYDVWSEAAGTAPGGHGTSFLLHILPLLTPTTPAWNFKGSVGFNAGTQGGPGSATTDFPEFYCSSIRRTKLRSGDSAMMLASWWPGGGTDYGGCVGRHVAYDTSSPITTSSMRGLQMQSYSTPVSPSPTPNCKIPHDNAASRWGIFGRVNVSTTYREIRDGLSNTIMTGELQRIVVTDAQHGGANNLSHDGWAVGGDATGFTTGYGGPAVKIDGQPTPVMNNGFFQSPGSDHPGGANFGMADGSVQFFSTSVDPNVFALLGSIDDSVPTGEVIQ